MFGFGLTRLEPVQPVPWFICIVYTYSAMVYLFSTCEKELRLFADLLHPFFWFYIPESRSEFNSWSFAEVSLLAWNRGAGG